MPSPTEVFRSNANALITGGASGVGLAVAKLCASHDMNLYLVDWNSEALDKVKSSINTKARLTTHKIDVSDLSQWAELKKAVEQDLNGAKLDFLHLNAGIGADSPWRENENWRKILEVNLFGVINGINTFVDHFDTNTDGKQKAIVLTGSKQGITNPPGRPAYNASKAAVNSVAQGLSFEMANVASMTSVHMLVPGWTFTGLTGGGGLKEKPAGAWSAEQVAEHLYRKMGEGVFGIICPDNDVDWETDRKRMMWTAGDLVFERQPLSRWREGYKGEAAKTMEQMQLGQKQGE